MEGRQAEYAVFTVSVRTHALSPTDSKAFSHLWCTFRGAPLGSFIPDRSVVLRNLKQMLGEKTAREDVLAAMREPKSSPPSAYPPLPTVDLIPSLPSSPSPAAVAPQTTIIVPKRPRSPPPAATIPSIAKRFTCEKEMHGAPPGDDDDFDDDSKDMLAALRMSMELKAARLDERLRELEKINVPPPPPPSVEPACSVCLLTRGDLLADGLGGLQPTLVDCDADSPAVCTHMLCQGCMERSIDVFLANSECPMLKCTECEKKNVPIRRRFLDASLGQYIVDPSTFAFRLSRSQTQLLGRKTEYLRAIGGHLAVAAAADGEDIPWEGGLRCPVCAESAAGPITRACLNLARCGSDRCLMIFCVYCNRAETHDSLRCPTLLKLKALRAAPFDPKDGRTCPYPGCTGVCIQHYRSEGCHIVTCWVCSRKLCFVCGNPKAGDEHHVHTGRSCRCAIFCDSTCPCIPFPTRPTPAASVPPAVAPRPTLRAVPSRPPAPRQATATAPAARASEALIRDFQRYYDAIFPDLSRSVRASAAVRAATMGIPVPTIPRTTPVRAAVSQMVVDDDVDDDDDPENI